MALEGCAEKHACLQAIKKEILGEDDEDDEEEEDEDDEDDDEDNESDEEGAGQQPGAASTQRIQVCCWILLYLQAPSSVCLTYHGPYMVAEAEAPSDDLSCPVG